MAGIYLYGIVRFPPGLARTIPGLGASPVYLLDSAHLAAVVSRSALRLWPVDRAHLHAHEAVVEELMDSRPVLPARFNTVLRSEEMALSFLRERGDVFRSALARVGRKVELGVRVLWEPPGEPRAPEPHGAECGTAYLGRRLAEERRRAEVQAEAEQLIRRVDAIAGAGAQAKWLQALPTDRLLVSGAYLVEREEVTGFRNRVAQLRERFPQLRFLVTGPWPPYHFVPGVECDGKGA